MEILRLENLAPILSRRVESKSMSGTYHIVSLFGDGRLTCDCIAGQMHKVCRHQKIFLKWIH